MTWKGSGYQVIQGLGMMKTQNMDDVENTMGAVGFI